MTRNRYGLFLIILVMIFSWACATDQGFWKKAEQLNTVKAYEDYLRNYPNGRFANKAKKKKAILIEEWMWRKAKKANKFKGYADYLSSHPRGKYVKEARKAIPRFYLLNDAQIKRIATLQRTGKPEAKRLDYVEKLLFTGANCLDNNANWTNQARGRQVYYTLKKYDSKLLTKAMTRVVLMQINRLHVLFLVVKLGIPGTQKPLNDLLMKYGNKSMAEDYLNCGSKELHDGGVAWARSHGYMISTGFGSHRVGWGRF